MAACTQMQEEHLAEQSHVGRAGVTGGSPASVHGRTVDLPSQGFVENSVIGTAHRADDCTQFISHR